MRKILFVLVAITLLLALALLIRFAMRGPQGAWTCRNGAWTKQGSPTTAMPAAPCEAEPLPPTAQ